MLRQSQLVSAAALSRYDDSGDPVYTTAERIVLALRWFGWISADGLRDALEIADADDVEKKRYVQSIARLVKRGVVEERGATLGKRGRGEREYRLNELSPKLPLADVPHLGRVANS